MVKKKLCSMIDILQKNIYFDYRQQKISGSDETYGFYLLYFNQKKEKI
jgi:hypothetical protein